MFRAPLCPSSGAQELYRWLLLVVFGAVKMENVIYKLGSVNVTYLLTPWSRVLLEKLTGSAASQEIPRFFGTRRFITVLTSSRHLSLS